MKERSEGEGGMKKKKKYLGIDLLHEEKIKFVNKRIKVGLNEGFKE